MKRVLSIVISIALILTAVTAAAEADYPETAARVCGLGIMGNDDNGDFRAEDKITRAEFTAVICRMFLYDNIGGQDTGFADVPSSHWASGYIAAAHGMGWINGSGDGLFMPEADITYGEAVKILVCALDYDLTSDDIKFPGGYISIAAALGMTKNAPGVSETITRAQTAVLIDNTLDVNPLEWKNNEKLVKSDKTLYRILSDRKDMEHIRGILTETGNLSMTGEKEPDKFVTVEGVRLHTDTNYDDYLGQYVEVYYNTDDDKIAELIPQQKHNQIDEIEAADTVVNETSIDYYNEDGRKRSLTIHAETVFLLNGGIVSRDELRPIYQGVYRAIDNDSDGVYDVILITELESFIVKSVSADNTRGNTVIYFKDDRMYHGRKGFVFKDENTDVTYVITDKDGNAISIEEISEGCSITLAANQSETYVKAYVNNERRSGRVTSVSAQNGEIEIEDEQYKIGRDAEGKYTFVPSGMTEGDFVIDAFGYVIGTWKKQESDFTYAYVVNTKQDKFKDELKLLVVSGTEPVYEEKTIGDKKIVSYYLQNSDMQTLCASDKVVYGDNPANANGRKVKVSELDSAVFKDSIIGYTLDNEGKIKNLNVYTVPMTLPNYEFNGELFSFGGMRVSRGFLKDEHTKVVCVPNTVRAKDDYNVNVKITDGSSYKVYGVRGSSDKEYGSQEAMAEPCDIIIIKSEMDSAMPPNISADNDICIVGNLTLSLDDNGDTRYKLDILNGSTAKTYYAYMDGVASSEVAKLRKGDLIQFTSNAKGEITGVKKRASVQGLKDYTDIDNIYGEVTDVKYNIYDYYNNEMVDVLNVNTGNGIAGLKLFKKDGQKVYLYDRRSGYIYPSSTEDILAAGYFGDEASKVFALMEDNEAKAIVIIWD